MIAVHGPYHASHLHSEVDVEKILKSSDPRAVRFLDQYKTRLPVQSTSSGSWFDINTGAGKLLTAAVRDILNEPLRMGQVLSSCVDAVTSLKCLKTRIISCGPTELESTFVATLKSKTTSTIVVDDASGETSTIPLGQSTATPKRPKIAIVGMAGRFPNAADHEKFWSLLEAGLDVHKKIPKDRFDAEKHYDPAGKIRNTSHTPFGCFIDEPGLFDPLFFNMSPREALQTDPMHRLGLASAYEALEMAGYVPNRTPSTKLDRIGTFYGQTSDDWREINAAQDVDTYFITGGVRAWQGRINYYFKFSGPSFSVDTACSSSMAAIQLACTSLWAEDCDTAVAGGLNVMTNSDIFAGLSRGRFLSKTGNCQTFDNDADGYCRGDGVGTLILKRLEDAEADNDRILGVVLDTATNHSANAVSITHPHAPAQETLFKAVMDNSGVDPHDVSYVEMHGTGTQAGDGTEMLSVTNVFAPVSRKGTRQKSLHLGSVKSNIGHGEASSGVTALIKCLLMLQKNRIPPHCGIKTTINQGFPKDLNARNVHIAFKPTPLTSADGSPRRIFVNNFSAAGGNTAMLLEDAPSRFIPRNDPRSDSVIAVSAKSKSSLRANLRRLVQYLDERGPLQLADLSYTTTARRIHHNYRVAFSCNSIAMARDMLASKSDDSTNLVPSVKPQVAFVFTGQGSHYKFLAKQLYENSTQFRSDLLSFDNIGYNQGFPSFLPLILEDSELYGASPMVLQLGLCCIQMALVRLWASWGIEPDIVLGHSLGEYAALNAAGVISASETIFLVGERARLLHDKCFVGSHAMLAVKTSAKSVKEAVAKVSEVEIACINAPQETVLSGPVAEIDKAADELRVKGIRCTKLNVQFAFHSTQVNPILTQFQRLASSVVFHKPKVPVISPLLSGVLSESDNIDEEYLSNHARGIVNFHGALESAQQLGLINDKTVWLELGPHPVCSSFIKSGLGQSIRMASSLNKNMEPYKSISDSLAFMHTSGFAINWDEYHRDFLDCLHVLDLPAYAFDNKNYWIDYVGNWNLHKGQTNGLAILPGVVTPSLSTTTVQKVISEVVEADKATLVVESDVSRADLLAAISGHQVNGTALCPSSIYADMALTVGNYLYKVLRPDAPTTSMNVCKMEVSKPFIANTSGDSGQVLRLTTKLDVLLGRADLLFTSGNGNSEVEHAKCHLEFGSGSAWLAEWQRNAYLITGRINSLKKDAASGNAHTMLRGMAYKLFGALVDYDPKYRGMKEVILDSPQLEATSQVVFQTTEADGTFFCSPYWIDSVAHLAGFVVNANDALDSGKQVYISHGWESLRFAEPLSALKTYRSYVKMQTVEGNMALGDVYILDQDRIIGMVGALKFQCIPRQLLNTFLPPKGSLAMPKPILSRSPPVSKVTSPITTKSTKKVPAKVSVDSTIKPSIAALAFGIIATETGIQVNELTDGTEFVSIGVDSLLSLAITGRFREELEFEIPSSLFVDYPSVGAMKQYLAQMNSGDVGDLLDNRSAGNLTPSLDSDSDSIPDEASSAPTSPGSPSELDPLSMVIRETISCEMGVDIAEVVAATDLTSLGMDSLMSLSILGVLREKTGMSLPSTLLLDNLNIAAIEKSLQIGTVEHTPKRKDKLLLEGVRNSPKISKPDRVATSVLLQGNPRISTKDFWLVPDGGGSATSYTYVPEISRKIAVWGLNSPYMTTPEEYTCGVVGMATMFIREMKRRQPRGPYNVGGWSAGGVIAFEIVRQLTEDEQTVEVLALIDSPCPLIIEPLPSSLHRFFGSIGLLGKGDGALEQLPPWLLPHFAASVQALSTYTAQRINPARTPKVFTIWCEDGVCKYPDDPRPDPYPYGHAQWLLENRVDFGPNLWDEYLDKSKIFSRRMCGNHFSMVRPPYVEKLTEFLREALL